MTGCKNYFILNSNFAHKDSILLKNIQGFGIYRNIYETIQLPVRTLSLSLNRSGTKFAEKHQLTKCRRFTIPSLEVVLFQPYQYHVS